MNQQEQDECFDALVFSLTALIRTLDAGTLDGRRMIATIETAADGLLELKTADNLHRSIIAVQEKIIARQYNVDRTAIVELQRIGDALAADNLALFDSNLALQDMLDSARGEMEVLREQVSKQA